MKTREKEPVKQITSWQYFFNKMPMDHIVHLRNQFKSINTFEKSYDHNLTLIRSEGKKTLSTLLRIEWSLFVKNLSFFTQGCFMPSLVEIGEEDF